MSVKINAVQKKSIASKYKIKANDILLKINGHEINDVLDYMFYVAENNIEIEYSHKGKNKNIKIKKSEYDDLGLEFSTFLMDNKKSCHNKCAFCFIDQMPPNMRETLYFKDDDVRLSFLHGNYVTLTNLSDNDIKRIIDMRLNINVSVHTTNPELRCKMMNNKFAGDKLKYLKMMADANLLINCQIVLCPGLNDGDELERTLTDLGNMHPAITSVAVVPVGLSKFRDGLFPLVSFTKKTANDALDLIEKKQNEFFEKFGTKLVFPSDEFFLTAEREIPDDKYYEDYSQYENGVGLIRVLVDEFSSALDECDLKDKTSKVSIATGFAAENTINYLVKKLKNKYSDVECNVYSIKNEFFGESITVAGLITGQDLINQLKDKDLGKYLIIPSVMLKSDENIFLDDYTLEEVEKELNIHIVAINNTGQDLLNAIIGNL